MKTADALIYLASCVVNQIKPDTAVLSSVDCQKLLQTADRHQLKAIAITGLRQAGMADDSLAQELYNIVFTDKQFDTERNKILDQLEKNCIWYMPLKGVILKKMYPQPYLRQMSDNDILFDADRADDVHNIMTSLGYETAIFESGHRDDYRKPPIHFEMHRVLFENEIPSGCFYQYYAQIKQKMIKDPDNCYGYSLSQEDFYIYMIAHEYKHYIWMGTGLRSLLDVYVFLQYSSNDLNWDYISEEQEKLGLTEFEKKNRELASRIFKDGNTETLSEEEQTELRYYTESGAYGYQDHWLKHHIERDGKLKYILQRAFLPLPLIKIHYPLFYKYKILIPVLPLYRLFRRRKTALSEIKKIREI